MKFPKKTLVYTMGLFTGIGVTVASLSGAADSVIPYQFKDGQVISADTLNDLFSQIKNSTQGFSAVTDLNGVWTCRTYDATSSSSITANTPSANFSNDSTTNVQAMTQTWTFDSSNFDLTISPGARLGGITQNITGICNNGTGSANYQYKVVHSALMMTGRTAGCDTSGYVVPIQRISPYVFRFTQGSTVVACESNNQPPSIPTNLSASLSSGGVTLTWSDAGGSPSGFNVLKKVDGTYTSVGTVSSGTTTYTDSSGASGDLYRVKSTNSNGASLPSTAAIAK